VAAKVTLYSPGGMLSLPSHSRVKWPLSSLRPAHGRPLPPTGVSVTIVLGSALPSRVTSPETLTCDGLQPAARSTTASAGSCNSRGMRNPPHPHPLSPAKPRKRGGQKSAPIADRLVVVLATQELEDPMVDRLFDVLHRAVGHREVAALVVPRLEADG